MSQTYLNIAISPHGEENKNPPNYGQNNLGSCDRNRNVSKQARVSLSEPEERVLNIIGNCLKNWYKPWKEAFLADGREFKAVYDLMNCLLHYEQQITGNDTALPPERTNKIAQAVTRLVDFGNAILNIDLIIRSNDETSSELDPMRLTTIELYQAHVRAHNLKEKLLYDYFKKEKRRSGSFNDENVIQTPTVQLNQSMMSLQVPSPSFRSSSPTLPSLASNNKSLSPSIGSNCSINTLTDQIKDGRKTPTASSAHRIELVTPATDISSKLEMTHMIATIRSNAFSSPSNSTSRLALSGILAKVNSLLSSPPNAEKISNCFEICDALLDVIESLPGESRKQEVNLIADSLLEPIVRRIHIDDRDNFVELQNAHWTTLLVSIMRLMTPNDFNDYIGRFGNLRDLSAFLKDYLFIIKRLTSTNNEDAQAADVDNIDGSSPTYPDCWVDMKLVASRTFLTSLTYIYRTMCQFFQSNQGLWSSFLDCLVHFLVQDILRPGRSMLKQRQVDYALEISKMAAEYVWIAWDALSFEMKQSLFEELLEPLLRACMTLRSQQRSILLPVFYDMMKCNYRGQYVASRGSSYKSGNYSGSISYESDEEARYIQQATLAANIAEDSLPYLSLHESSEDSTVLTRFTHSIVAKLYTLMIELNYGDELFKCELCAALSGNLNPKYHVKSSLINQADHVQFNIMAKHTSDLLFEFMQICLDLRKSKNLNYMDLYLLCLFKLILFFRDKVDLIQLYLQNLYKLCALHRLENRFVEAGYTLLEYAKTLEFSNAPIEGPSRIITRYFRIQQDQLTDSQSLKIFLYNTIIDYFDRGQLWEAAVPLCQELTSIYQTKTYEYAKLAHTYQRLSQFYSNMIDLSKRVNPEYFRVTFYGIGFPPCIRNETMVYRGKPYQKLGDFQAQILSKYPDAKLLQTLSKPDESILMQPNARYLQINACSPVVDIKSKFACDDISSIDNSILIYHKYNECDKFEFSRRISKPIPATTSLKANDASPKGAGDEFADMWRERTTLSTNTLPGMLAFFPVYFQEPSVISPIESAIEDLERANDRLSAMVNRFKADEGRQEEDVRLLGQLLLGVVDPAVNGGITKYEKAFFNVDLSPRQQYCSVKTNKCGAMYPPQLNAPQMANVSKKMDPVQGVEHQEQQQHHNSNDQQPVNSELGVPTPAQVDKLKRLIAQQVPILDQAIRLHSSRVADIMRPQHEYLESAYKKLKHDVMTKYSRYLPSDYVRSSMRTGASAYRSLTRSPNRTLRHGSISSRLSEKRLSDVGFRTTTNNLNDTSASNLSSSSTITGDNQSPNNHHHETSGCSIPYRQLNNERRSLPFLTGVNLLSSCGTSSYNPTSPSPTPRPLPRPDRQPPIGEGLVMKVEDVVDSQVALAPQAAPRKLSKSSRGENDNEEIYVSNYVARMSLNNSPIQSRRSITSNKGLSNVQDLGNTKRNEKEELLSDTSDKMVDLSLENQPPPPPSSPSKLTATSASVRDEVQLVLI